MIYIGISSNLYPLEAGDLKRLPDFNGTEIDTSSLKDDVVVLIRKNLPDVLLKGRRQLQNIPSEKHVSTRIAFVPSVPKWFIFPNFIRVLREKFRYKGSNIYHVSPRALRELGVERTIRNRSNAYKLRQLCFDDNKCASRYENLYNKIKTGGYDDSKPMTVMVCRQGGMIDSLKQGHHRMGVCLDCGIDRVAVQFSAAGCMPQMIARLFKHWKGKSVKNRSCFDLVCSIGYNCDCASLLRKKGLRDCSMPFDWLIGASFETRIRLIETHFEDFMLKENLQSLPSSKGSIAKGMAYYKDVKNNIIFYHDFPQDVAFDKSYEEVRKKYNRRIERFYSRINSSKSVALIWKNASTPLSQEELKDAEKRLSALFPNVSIKIVPVSDELDMAEIKQKIQEGNKIKNITTRFFINLASMFYFSKKKRHRARKNWRRRLGME